MTLVTNPLYGQPTLSAAGVLREIADYLGDTNGFDTYGEGQYLQNFEAEIAEMFGKEAGVFMPSGTMAQQIALRIWCDRANNPNIAMHPSAHLETSELLGYQHLHQLKRLEFSTTDFVEARIPKVSDFEQLGSTPGAILLELPCRPLGGQLPSFDELEAIAHWAKDKQVAMHMDGARIWQCRPHFGKSFAEIANLFDSVYVSFYKDIGGMFGCMLMGDAQFITESRVWLRRHGGNLINQGAAVVSSKMGIERILPRIDNWVEKAKELAVIFNQFEGVKTNPAIPQASMFQLWVEGDANVLNEKNKALEEETGTVLFKNFVPTAAPGMAMTEIHVFDNAMSFDLGRIGPFVDQLLGN